jgi:predicted glycoside hydrolase/deacetylase ChbG (UPF0249 family)
VTPPVVVPMTTGALGELARSLVRRELAVYDEAAAQVRKIVAAGIVPTHIDTHKHTHLFPPVLEAVSRVAREFGIPWVRAPFDFAVSPAAGLKTRAWLAAMRLMRPRFRNSLAGLRTTDHFAGFQLTGSLETASMLETLRQLPEGLTEFMCHPGICGTELRGAPTRLKESRAAELAALTSREVRAAIDARGIELTNYRSGTRF